MAIRLSDMCAGSSPLARGALRAGHDRPAHRGLIPARAGSTAAGVLSADSSGAHPRSRGEHTIASIDANRDTGSSPLARGAPGSVEQRELAGRLIPARAGSTQGVCLARGRSGAHPRSRGEHAMSTAPARRRRGSSPLARGAPREVGVGVLARGLIPARAGSTLLRLASRRGRGAHPRSRGEHPEGVAIVAVPGGSSPLARGAPRATRRGRLRRGLIPARAGSTSRRRPARSSRRAHPRSRGEHAEGFDDAVPKAGSSPLARGAPSRVPGDRERTGLIPARAGSTTCRSHAARPTPAHPRSRGEHKVASARDTIAGGSSPLARGAHRRRRRRDGLGRLIPARAGSTMRPGR